MSALGTAAKEISAILGVSQQTISNWRNRWTDRGPFGLKDAPRPGGPRRVTPRYLRLMQEAVDRNPQAYGYIFTTWSVKRLATHLHRKTRLRLSAQHLRRLLHQSDFVCRRPKHTLKGRRNERQYRRVKNQLQGVKRGLCGQEPDMNSGMKTKRTFICIRT
jgi:transposase